MKALIVARSIDSASTECRSIFVPEQGNLLITKVENRLDVHFAEPEELAHFAIIREVQLPEEFLYAAQVLHITQADLNTYRDEFEKLTTPLANAAG